MDSQGGKISRLGEESLPNPQSAYLSGKEVGC
jgi:hypothetical protein